MIRAQLRELRRRFVLKVHGTGSRVAGGPSGNLEDQPIPPDWIESGTPQARGSCAIKSDDGRIQAGEWTCTAGKFRWHYFEDEVIRILEGEAFIEVDGTFQRFGPGDMVFFPLGQIARWHVPKFVHKTYFLAKPGNIVEFLRTAQVFGPKRAPESPLAT